MNARITFENVFGRERAVPFVTWFYDEPAHPGVAPSSRESSPAAPSAVAATDNKQSVSGSSQSGSPVKRHTTPPVAGGGSDERQGTTADTTIPEVATEAAGDTGSSAGAGAPNAAPAGGNASGRKRVVCIVDEHAFQIPHDYTLIGEFLSPPIRVNHENLEKRRIKHIAKSLMTNISNKTLIINYNIIIIHNMTKIFKL